MRTHNFPKGMSFFYAVLLMTLLAMQLAHVPRVQAQQDIEWSSGITVDVGGVISGLWGLITGKLTVKEAIIEMDARGFVEGATDLGANEDVKLGASWGLSGFLEAPGSFFKKIVAGLSFDMSYSKSWTTSLGEVTGEATLSYDPAQKKVEATGSVKLPTFDLGELVKVDLTELKVDWTLLRKGLKLLELTGYETYGNPSTPGKPETLKGPTSGQQISPEDFDLGKLFGSSNQSFEINATDPTRMDFEGNMTGYYSLLVGGDWMPIDKIGLLAPYIGLTSAIIVPAVATIFIHRRVKHRKTEK